jgi:nucleoside-triphosphatase
VPLLLISGVPGVGKTTALRRAATLLADRPVRGFVSDEVRERGSRIGFDIETFDGGRATMARVGFASSARVGRYGVDVAAIDEVVAATLVPPDRAVLYLIDEIGKMECFSSRFVEAVRALLAERVVLVATVAAKGSGLIAEIKRHPGA